MLSLKHVTKHRSLFSSILTFFNTNTHFSSFASSSPLPSCAPPVTQNDVVDSFKTWFTVHHRTPDPLLRHIYQILSYSDDFSAALSVLSLPLSEKFVLNVLRYDGNDISVLSRLKFFDWAGRQPGFYHTRATYIAIFRILSSPEHSPIILEYLRNFINHVIRRRHGNQDPQIDYRVRFNDTLVVGYAIAGKPAVALQVFGNMHFQGLDLDCYGYHVLLNALIEYNYFNAFDEIERQIRMRGYQTHVTNVMVVKCLCRQGRFEEAEAYLSELVSRGQELHGSELSFLVGALCESDGFDRAVELVRQFGSSGLVHLDNAYGVLIKHLVQVGRLNEALEFFWHKKNSEGYAPAGARYNSLICRLLRQNRLLDVYDLLMDMNETSVPPDLVTMNAVMCFFCKAGMVEVSLELFKSRSQFGMSLNHMAYKYLILTLCWDGSFKEAYSVFRCAVGEGYFPDRPTFSTLANALCRGCKIDEMKELLHLALVWGFLPNASTYDRFISALCQTGRVEDGYLIHGDVNNVTARDSYVKMIKGFIRSNRGDIAARLLAEMKDNGYELKRAFVRPVLCSLLDMGTPAQFFNLLERLTNTEPRVEIYNHFISAAAHAEKTELAREVYELMQRNGIRPNQNSKILMVESFLKRQKISDALNFFDNLQSKSKNVKNKKVYNALIIGLCRNSRPDIARDLLFEMFKVGLNPSIESYENLVKQFCSLRRYHEAINLVNLYEKIRYEKSGYRLTSFIGNVLLFHSLISPEVYDACVRLRGVKEVLTLAIGAFTGRLRVNHSTEELEGLIAKCFKLDIYTYNMLLRKVTNFDMDQACVLFHRMYQKGKGYEPNRWTYDIMIHGFSKHGRHDEAEVWHIKKRDAGFYEHE